MNLSAFGAKDREADTIVPERIEIPIVGIGRNDETCVQRLARSPGLGLAHIKSEVPLRSGRGRLGPKRRIAKSPGGEKVNAWR
jgi:hypothetical protein